MANTDQLIIDIWHKSDTISSNNFESLLHELVTTNTVPDSIQLITKLQIPQQEQQTVSDIIKLINEFFKNPKKKHDSPFRALKQLYEDLKIIRKNIDSIKSLEASESSPDSSPAFWKDNTAHLKLNRIQKNCLIKLNKLYNSKKISSFKLAKYLYSILTKPQKTIFSKYFERYTNYAQFCNEIVKNDVSAIALEHIHTTFEHQDEQKSVSYIDYMNQIFNTLSHSAQRQFNSAKWYMAVWTLVTFLKKHEILYKTNPAIKNLCNEYGLNNIEFTEFYDRLSSHLNDQLKYDLKKMFQAYFDAEKKSTDEESDNNFSETEEQSHATKRKSLASKESEKQPLHENPGFDARIKQASEKHIPSTNYFNYNYYSQSTEMRDKLGKKYKVLTNKLAIPPRNGLSEAAAYQEGLAIKQYLIDKCQLNANSAKNILVQPIKQDAKWQEENSYKLRHHKQTIEFDYTIDPHSPIGTVIARGFTILTIVSHYHLLPPGFNKDKVKNAPSAPTKKSKSDASLEEQHASLLTLANASSAQPKPPSKFNVQEESTGETITPPSKPAAAKTPTSHSAGLQIPAALFGSRLETPTPYQVTTSATPVSSTSQIPGIALSAVVSPAAASSITKTHPSEDEVIEISDDETTALKQKLVEVQKLLNQQQQQLAQAKNETAKQRSEFLAEKKRRHRESLDKINADLAATQLALAAEQQEQEKLKKMRAGNEQKATETNITSPALTGRR